ncbi:NAD(P)/FAD-dependent oxidoreductase [Aeromicrobium wangtongii]|uniref:FAD-binding oxidoreductase n=1 Tax=Aeromicrobium wangtongii TaxID=2969247 RepID=A0ABY5M5U8_9ACTN|nr:FAD-binding oxidoreductase [Aeromicrobium wangtongii]MCD9199917.1 FAD-binding oxidoreductase [Aeromicrobium wangtongii]UUP13534.1 FAD-binding oxidoreductase [Aeromicrobium wangtongii]
MINGGVSFWWQQIGVPVPRESLDGDLDCDVCIVGGGLTGLWTAYTLAELDPTLDIVVLEAEFAGFGASGRNGGWLSAELSGSKRRYAATHGREGVTALVHAMEQAVDDVIEVCRSEGIDADVVKNGVLYVARTPAQLVRLREHLSDDDAWGIGVEHQQELTADEVDQRVRVEGTVGGTFSPHCARVHPAKLVAGIAAAIERRGVRILERTRVTRIDPGVVTTQRGTVRAPRILRCLEGYTASVAGQRRTWLPMNSAMIVTEPLPDRVWDDIGWTGSELLGDSANAYCYAQRTADGRIALGGRGIPYRFGSRTDTDGRTQDWTVASLTAILHDMFPATRPSRIDHAWCGVLGVPRDWCASVGFDTSTGLGWAGGYVGSGLTTTQLAGRTLADLATGRDTDLTHLPWVDRPVRPWEPEPLRWLGVRAMYGLYREADRREGRGLTRPSRLARIGNLLTGR